MNDKAQAGREAADPKPLGDLEEWEDFVKQRYASDAAAGDSMAPMRDDGGHPGREFRDYRAEARPSVREFYRINHEQQTLEFVRAKKRKFLSLDRRRMSIWEAMEYLNTLVDDSDPDTEVSQLEHLLQTSEAIRAAGRPRWFIAAGLVHDLGKILCLYDEPQWAVVGDTFAVGCRFSEKIVYPEFFAANRDSENAELQTECGVYEPGCGLNEVHVSWGHDEYVYHVCKDYLPEPALYMLRYHSFYAAHREGAYGHLMNDRDREMFKWVRAFNQFDLYSKADVRPDAKALRPFYDELISEFFPPVLAW